MLLCPFLVTQALQQTLRHSFVPSLTSKTLRQPPRYEDTTAKEEKRGLVRIWGMAKMAVESCCDHCRLESLLIWDCSCLIWSNKCICALACVQRHGETSGGGEEKLSRRKFLKPPSNMCKTSLVKCKREGKESRGLKDNEKEIKVPIKGERGRPLDNKGED